MNNQINHTFHHTASSPFKEQQTRHFFQPTIAVAATPRRAATIAQLVLSPIIPKPLSDAASVSLLSSSSTQAASSASSTATNDAFINRMSESAPAASLSDAASISSETALPAQNAIAISPNAISPDFRGLTVNYDQPLTLPAPSTSSAQAQSDASSITLTLNSTTASSTASSTATTRTSLESANDFVPDPTLLASTNASLVSSGSSSASISQTASLTPVLEIEPELSRILPNAQLPNEVQNPILQQNGPSKVSWYGREFTRSDYPDLPDLPWYKRLLNIYFLIFFPAVDALRRALTLDLPNGSLSPEGLATMKQEGGWIKAMIKLNDNLLNEVKTGKDNSRKAYARDLPEDPYLIEGYNLKTRGGIDSYMAAHHNYVYPIGARDDYLIIEDAGVVLYRDRTNDIYTKISFSRPNGSIWKKKEIEKFFLERYLPNKEVIRAELTGANDTLFIDREKTRVGIWQSAHTEYGQPIVIEDGQFFNENDAFTKLFFKRIKPRVESRRASEHEAPVIPAAAAPAPGPALVTPTQPLIETDDTAERRVNNLNVVS